MSQVYDEPIVVRLTVPVRGYPVGSEFGFDDVADAVVSLGSASFFEVVRTQDGDPIPPLTPEDKTEAEQEAIARAKAQRIVRGADLDALVPGPGEVIVGSADGPVAVNLDEIGGNPDAVSGVGVQRIIASSDPDYPLQDGDLLILIEVPSSLTDFAAYPTAVAPEDWSKPWVQGNATWTVESATEATGGKVLRGVVTASGRNALVWDAMSEEWGASPDVEIVYKWRTSHAGAGVRSVARASGSEGTETGYYYNLATSGNTARMGRVLAGSNFSFATAEPVPEITINTWYITRFRVNGSTLSGKTWLASQPEPDEWQVEGTDAQITDAGVAGVYVFNTATVDFDWVGYGFGGDAAPKGD